MMKTSALPILRPSLKEALTALFTDPREKAFFFALDGVLVPGPCAGASPSSEVPVALLADLERASGGAVAILSGEPLDAVDRVLAPLRLAGCGLGGLEIRPHADGPCVRRRIAADLDPVRRLFGSVTAQDHGLRVIDGGLALTLCHEGDPERAAVAKTFAHDALALAPAAYRADFDDDATRVTFAGASMGSAICRIMEDDRFVERIPVVFGPAGRGGDYLAVAQYFGGTAVAVGAGEDRDADIRLDGPRDVHWIIRDFLAQLEIESGGVP